MRKETIKKRPCKTCGKLFIPNHPNNKYCCDKCKAQGSKKTRKRWEEETGYTDKQREKMRAYREIKALERIAIEEAKTEAIESRRAKAQEEAKIDLETAAKGGDLEAKLELIFQEGGNTSFEYWEAWKEKFEIEEPGRKAFVNDISTDNPDFAFLVSMSIHELKIIRMHITT